MSKKTASPLILFMIILAVLLTFYNLYIYFTTNLETELVDSGTIENSVLTKGYSIRDEHIVLDEGGGIINSYVSEGERVSKGTLIAAYYSLGASADKQDKLKDLNDRILNLERLKSSSYARVIKAESIANEKLPEIVEYAHKGMATKLNEIKLEIQQVIDESIATNRNEISALIEELERERLSIENSIEGDKKDIYSSITGIYCLNKDGYENQFDYENVVHLTVDEFDKLSASEDKRSDKGVIKVINNYKWRFVTKVPEKKVSALKTGSTVKIRFTDYGSQSYKASVVKISESKNGQVLLVLEGQDFVECLFNKRELSCEVIFGSETGLKLNKDAVRVIDGKTGVYIVKSGVVRFREIDILATDDDYVIVQERYEDLNDHLLLYDSAVIKGEVQVGQMVK